ncbi:DEK C-terminal domain-containing protein, partial [Klebsiella pneumoniae]|uniref:DEK C-terminal domain-containing protein n=1 Tax=Klebsiella pneumoniae TaxID=573 RepID=UPI0035320D89
ENENTLLQNLGCHDLHGEGRESKVLNDGVFFFPISVGDAERKGMDAEMKRRVEETVVDILEKADLTEMMESKVRSLASEQLGIDLSGSRGRVDKFLVSIPPPVCNTRIGYRERQKENENTLLQNLGCHHLHGEGRESKVLNESVFFFPISM